MTREDAMVVIRASIARGTVTPIFEPDRDAAVQKLAQSLEEAVIEPVPATIKGVAYEDTGLAAVLDQDSPFVIAHAGENWLGYLPGSGEFFLAYGAQPSMLNALGFHSSDALAEWRG